MNTHVYYWRGNAEARTDVLEGLSQRGFETAILRSVDEVLDCVAELRPSFIVVDATSSVQEEADRIVEMTDLRQLFEIPIVFLGDQATKRADVLEKQYIEFIAVDAPFDWDTLSRNIDKLFSNAAAKKLQEQFDASERLRRKLLSQYKDPKKLAHSYGGKFFSLAKDVEDFDDRLLLPEHPARDVISYTIGLMTGADPRVAVHARRMGYVAAALCQRLNLPEKRRSSLQTAALLLNWGVLESPLRILRLDPISGATQVELKQLADGFQKSADLIRRQLSDVDCAKTVEAVAALLRLEGFSGDREVLQDAQYVLAMELAARACWSTGYWNHYGAYRFVRSLRSDTPFVTNSNVVTDVIRVLGESICSHTTVCNAFVGIDGGSSSMAKADDPANLLVPVYDLDSEMELTMPLRARDGRVVLEAQTKLTEDLIHRLWQLAAVRALDSDVKIRNEN